MASNIQTRYTKTPNSRSVFHAGVSLNIHSFIHLVHQIITKLQYKLNNSQWIFSVALWQEKFGNILYPLNLQNVQ